MRKVLVVGRGYVGRGMEQMFGRAFRVSVWDPPLGHTDRRALEGADLAVVCVPTPQGPDGRCDTSVVEEVLSWIEAPLVCVKSTVPPGFTDDMNERDSRRRGVIAGTRFHFSPEYMGEPRGYVPGHLYPDPREPWTHDFCVVGGPRARDVLGFFSAVMAHSARYEACTARDAEMCKYAENAFLATKVTFCNEMARISDAVGADWARVRELWLLDGRVGRSHTVVHQDDPGFGGKCLPKDLAAIVAAATDAGYSPELLLEVLRSNERFRRGGETASWYPDPTARANGHAEAR